MKHSLAALAVLAIPATACAQAPLAPQPPETPNTTTLTEDCGEGCTRTIIKTRSAETDQDGHEIIRKDVEVIELRSDGGEDVDINIDVESETDGDVIVRKKVKVITAGDGEMTPEMRAKIDAMISELDGDEDGERIWHQRGDGVMVFKSDDSAHSRIIIRGDDEEIINAHGAVSVDQVENADGSKTIRITPEDGGETTVITIRKEKSSISDN